jgi:hypothetical protein
MKATRIAIGSFVFFTLWSFFKVELARSHWVFVMLVMIPVSAIVLLALFGFIIEALFYGTREAKSAGSAVREALAIPASLLLAVITYGPVHSLGIDVFAGRYLAAHRTEMARNERRAGPGEPAVITYYQGIPDSGISIFHYRDGSPLLVAGKVRRLISEPLNWCRTLEPSYYVCSHGG